MLGNDSLANDGSIGNGLEDSSRAGMGGYGTAAALVAAASAAAELAGSAEPLVLLVLAEGADDINNGAPGVPE